MNDGPPRWLFSRNPVVKVKRSPAWFDGHVCLTSKQWKDLADLISAKHSDFDGTIEELASVINKNPRPFSKRVDVFCVTEAARLAGLSFKR
jgi:hypothetical protein